MTTIFNDLHADYHIYWQLCCAACRCPSASPWPGPSSLPFPTPRTPRELELILLVSLYIDIEDTYYIVSMTIHINLKVLSSILYLALFPFWCSSACSSFRNGGGRPCWLAILTNGTELTVTASVSHWEEEELWWGREDGLAWWAAPQEATTTASTCPPGTGRQSCPPPCRGLFPGNPNNVCNPICNVIP